VSKKLVIIITLAGGLICFAGAFGLTLLTRPDTAVQAAQVRQAAATQPGEEGYLALPPQFSPAGPGSNGPARLERAGPGTGGGAEVKEAMKQRRLKNLIYEVREMADEYQARLRQLDVRRQRLQTAQELLEKDSEQLNNLRIELTSTVSRLKAEREKLKKSRIEISRSEKTNLVSIAATYDKMDAPSASKILTNMSKMQGAAGQSGIDDVVKILHNMTERTRAKLLAELVTTEPKLAASLCQRLKQIAEEE